MQVTAHTKLRDWLKANGKTQQWFAEAIECNQSAVSQYLTGRARPNYDRMVLISELTSGAVPVDSWPRTDLRERQEQAGKEATA